MGLLLLILQQPVSTRSWGTGIVFSAPRKAWDWTHCIAPRSPRRKSPFSTQKNRRRPNFFPSLWPDLTNRGG